MASGERAAGRRMADDFIIVALGGNLAADLADLQQRFLAALAVLPDHGVEVVGRSRFWRSAAWPDPSEPAYLNAIALVDTALGPAQVMAVLHRVEALFGRRRTQTNAPRALDLDLVAYGRQVRAADPILPHPRAAERLFVMGPLADVAPDWRHPITGERAAVLAGQASVGKDARPLPENP